MIASPTFKYAREGLFVPGTGSRDAARINLSTEPRTTNDYIFSNLRESSGIFRSPSMTASLRLSFMEIAVQLEGKSLEQTGRRIHSLSRRILGPRTPLQERQDSRRFLPDWSWSDGHLSVSTVAAIGEGRLLIPL